MAGTYVALRSRVRGGLVPRWLGIAVGKEVAMLVTVKVYPGASQDEVIERGRARFEIFVRAAPKEGAATRATARLLAAHLGMPVAALRLVRGARERNKIFEIPGSCPIRSNDSNGT